MNVELLDKAVAEALCPMFSAIAPVSSTIAVASPIAGAPGVAVGVTAAKIAALSMLGAAATCPEVEIGPDPGYGPDDTRRGCVEYSSGIGSVYVRGQGNVNTLVIPNVTGYKTEFLRYDEQGNYTQYTASVQYTNGGPYQTLPTPWTLEPGNYFEMEPSGEVTCAIEAEPTPVNPPVPDYTYVDQSTNCTYNVKFEGFIRQTDDGPISPVFEISSGGDTLRADGGRIGGCNLSPVIYAAPPNGPGGPQGPPIPPIPVPPSLPDSPDGVPWWAGPLLGGAVGAGLTLLGNAINEALAPQVPAGSFTFTAPCDKDEEGNNLERVWEFPTQRAPERSLSHQIAILEVLQQHLDWKTPTCREPRPQKRGTWISTNWISDAASPNSNRQIRKLFRYRSESTRTNDELQQYWADFEWTSGPVCVIHKGAWWGTPQVWAASAEEGQRVLRRAGSEAGLDPDQTGEWIFSSSDSPRYGVSLKMRLAEQQGERWVTRREGASGFPEL